MNVLIVLPALLSAQNQASLLALLRFCYAFCYTSTYNCIDKYVACFLWRSLALAKSITPPVHQIISLVSAAETTSSHSWCLKIKIMITKKLQEILPGLVNSPENLLQYAVLIIMMLPSWQCCHNINNDKEHIMADAPLRYFQKVSKIWKIYWYKICSHQSSFLLQQKLWKLVGNVFREIGEKMHWLTSCSGQQDMNTCQNACGFYDSIPTTDEVKSPNVRL